MDTTRAARPIPLSLTALIAFFSALAALAVSNGAAHAHGNEHRHATATAAVTQKQLVLRNEMRASGKTTSPGRGSRSSA